MATATELSPAPVALTDANPAMVDNDQASLSSIDLDEVLFWAALLRENLCNSHQGSAISSTCALAPRRKARDPHEAELAKQIAQLLYPSPSDSTLPALIKYEKDAVHLRRAIVAQEKIAEAAKAKPKLKPTPKERISSQGPWDEVNDPWPLTGAPALPMPVKVSDAETLEPFFRHLSNDGGYEIDEYGKEAGEEPYYGVKMGEWEKGVLYEDGRMDLCKQ